MTDVTTNKNPVLKKCLSKACRYFKKGFCGFGEKCSYRHSESKRRSIFSSNNTSDVENCPFYKKASCKFASKCWYKHVRPNGKVYPKPEPLNKFIVVGPSSEESVETEDTPSPVEDFVASTANILPQETEIRRSFKRPPNQDTVSKNCFYYEKKGTCQYGDKCWYSHSEPYEHPSDEFVHEANPDPELEPDPDCTKMCYNFIFTECEFGDECPYVHGNICQFCDLAFLHPYDERQRNEHLEACETFFLEDMDISFKIMISKDKTCAICLDYVWNSEKPFSKQKFGIQENCNHIFCLRCIRRWRDVKRRLKQPQLCPSCRKESFVVFPSARWFESETEKNQWIQDYTKAVRQKPCKFYAKGNCGNEGNCKYLHPGYIPPESVRENMRSNNLLPSNEQQGPGNSAGAEHVTDTRDQQDPEGIWDTSPEDQTNEDLAVQSAEHEIPINLADEHQIDSGLGQVSIVDDDEQNIERQVRQDTNNYDTPCDEAITINLADEHQFDSGFEQVSIASNDDEQNVERNFRQNAKIYDDTPRKKTIPINLADEQQLDSSLGQVNMLDDDQQNVERQVQQDTNNYDDTPGEEGIPVNLADEHQLDSGLGQVNIVDDDEQNVERQVRQNINIYDDTSENQLNEDLLLHSSAQISPRNSAETRVQQFNDNMEHLDVVDVDEGRVVEEDPVVSIDASS